MMPILVDSQKKALGKLRLSWFVYALTLFVFVGLGYSTLKTWWQPSYAAFWLFVSSFVLAYQLLVLWKGLIHNHRHGEVSLLPKLGLGNIASLVRGALIGTLFGFLILPRPSGWLTWAPGVIYTIAVLIDYIDGYLARLTNHVTRLGEALDMHFDSLGALVATLLIVQYGQVPWWYILVGLARYLFIFGMWLWKRLGKQIHELPFSNRRRGLAGVQMVFICVMLWPLFSPPGTSIAAVGFGVPFLISFLWDWLIVVGVIPADAGGRYPAWKEFVLKKLPLALRLIIVFLLTAQIFVARDIVITVPGGLLFGQGVVVLCIATGFAGRTAAILGLVLIGFQQMVIPLSTGYYLLAYLYIAILILGTGLFSFWKPEEWLIYHKAGERKD